MYRTLEHWACVGLSLVALVGSGAADHHHDNLYQIHRVEKEYRVLRARDSTCESGYSLCAASLGGDCCPSNYACAQTYCYATTAGPTSACGASGYYNCGSDSPGKSPSPRRVVVDGVLMSVARILLSHELPVQNRWLLPDGWSHIDRDVRHGLHFMPILT